MQVLNTKYTINMRKIYPTSELKAVSDSASALDDKMGKIHNEVKELKNESLSEQLDEVLDLSSLTATRDKIMQGILQQLIDKPKKLTKCAGKKKVRSCNLLNGPFLYLY